MATPVIIRAGAARAPPLRRAVFDNPGEAVKRRHAEICAKRAEEGARVAVNDAVEARAKEVAARIGTRALAVPADVTDGEAVNAMVEELGRQRRA